MLALFSAFLLVLIVGYAVGRWRTHAEAAESFSHATRVIEAVTEALGECPAICEEYATEQAAKDTLVDPPDESVLKEPWVQGIESACVTLGAQDCAMLIARHIDATTKRVRELGP